jgi:hypothetical protein
MIWFLKSLPIASRECEYPNKYADDVLKPYLPLLLLCQLLEPLLRPLIFPPKPLNTVRIKTHLGLVLK